jgi:hypothetical protein
MVVKLDVWPGRMSRWPASSASPTGYFLTRNGEGMFGLNAIFGGDKMNGWVKKLNVFHTMEIRITRIRADYAKQSST